MSTPMDDAAELAEDEDLARLVRERITSSLPSRPLAELAVEFGISLEHFDIGGRGSSELDAREIAKLLNVALGATLVSSIAGSHDPIAAHQWAQEDGLEPNREAVERLRLAHRAWALVSGSEGEDVARQWFVGENPWLDAMSPIEAISRLQSEAVMRAAQAMVDGTFAG